MPGELPSPSAGLCPVPDAAHRRTAGARAPAVRARSRRDVRAARRATLGARCLPRDRRGGVRAPLHLRPRGLRPDPHRYGHQARPGPRLAAGRWPGDRNWHLAARPPGVDTEFVAGTSLGDVIDRARRRSFVGRRSELRAFDNALAALSLRRVLFVHGPGGIGKTTLLLELRARASAAGRTAVLLHGSEIDPSPAGFRQAVEAAGLGARADGGAVLLVDGYEQLGAIDGWLRQDFVPSLRAEDVV